jgi:hypothetical protein
MINGTNLLGKHNPRWPIGNATETIKVPDAIAPAPRGPAPAPEGPSAGNASSRDWLATTAGAPLGIAIAWLSGFPRRAGRRLFAVNDAEAGWRGWQVTEFAGGLGRRYRDARFDALRDPAGRPVERDR